jgi:VWFA-related protein
VTPGFLVAGASAAILAGSVLAGPAQFRSGTDIVEVHATVKLRTGAIAHDLTRDEFELREDGKIREIAVFSRSVQPLSVALVLDRSGSTDPDSDNIRMAAQEFVGRMLKGDRVSINTLMWDCQPFTDDPRLLLTFLRRNLPRDWGSPIWSATDRVMTALESEGGRRVVVLFSDGEDTQPAPSSAIARPSPGFIDFCEFAGIVRYRSIGDVVKRAERDAVMVYTVIADPGDRGNGGGAGDLVRLAKQSGASSQRLTSESQLRAAFTSIADELHLQYLLGFVPTKSDGKRHSIDVRVKRDGVTVQARKGYVAAKKEPE